jgi:hypothetical protein
MPFLPEVIVSLLANFAQVFTVPTWKYAQTLLIGALLYNGKRTVSSALRAMGLSTEKRFERYHRVLSTAKWNEFKLSKILLGLLILLIPANMPVFIAMDETIERRSGKKITAKGCYRDACRSSHSLVIKCFGLKWLCAALIIKLPWSNRYWALPFMTVLCPSKKHDEQNGIKHKSSVERAKQLVYIISRLLKRSWILLGDGGFACVSLGNACVKSGATLISRLRLDAAVYDEIAEEAAIKKRGRKRVKGNKQPTLKQRLIDGSLTWTEQRIAWYGRILKNVRLASGVALWYKAGEKPLRIRWVIVVDPETNRTEAFFSTDINLSPAIIIEYFVLRWNLEVTFEEARAHLGVETQRQWSPKAIKRTTPVLFGLFSLVCLIGYRQNQQENDLVKGCSTAWYNKEDNATFSDVLAYVKRLILIGKSNYFKSASNDEFIKIRRQDLEILINNGFMAA